MLIHKKQKKKETSNGISTENCSWMAIYETDFCFKSFYAVFEKAHLGGTAVTYAMKFRRNEI